MESSFVRTNLLQLILHLGDARHFRRLLSRAGLQAPRSSMEPISVITDHDRRAASGMTSVRLRDTVNVAFGGPFRRLGRGLP